MIIGAVAYGVPAGFRVLITPARPAAERDADQAVDRDGCPRWSLAL